MNILQILPELNVGGVETGTVDFAKYLVEHEHQSYVISNGGRLVSVLKKNGTKHFTLPVHRKSLWNAVKMVKEVRRIILENDIDIVHARSRVPAWIAYFACRKTNASFITTCHGYYTNRLFSQVMGWGKYVIVPSQIIGKHMIQDYKVAPSRIRCIPRSVDQSRFKVQKADSKGQSFYTIAIVGRITPLKGHDYFFKSMAKVVRTFPNVKILVIGDAPKRKQEYKKSLEYLVQQLGLKEQVQFLGNRSDVAELLANSDVLVMSTVTQEAFGRVILEAQAVGVPVVATQVGGVVDIIDHEETGLLVPAKDTDAMAREVVRILKDRPFARRLVEAAKKKLDEQFTLEHMASKTLAVYDELMQSMNIMVIKIGSIGDVVMITSALQSLRQKFPKAQIFSLVGEESKQILQNCPYLDGIIVYDPKNKHKGFLKFLKIVRKIRKFHPDKIIDFQNNRKSHWMAFLSAAKESYGFNNGKWGFLLTNPVKKYDRSLPGLTQQFQILKLLGIEAKEVPYLELWPSAKDRQYVKSLLDSEWLGNAKNIVGINIAASEKWPTKNLPVEYLAKICDSLAAKNFRVIITGMKKDQDLANQLLKLTKSKPALFIGKTDILQLAALIKRCHVYVTPDSAPMHVAAAMQVPIVALFGPTDSTRHKPPAKKISVLERKMECAPCYGRFCRIGTHACMNDIRPDDVIQEILKYMDVTKIKK